MKMEDMMVEAEKVMKKVDMMVKEEEEEEKVMKMVDMMVKEKVMMMEEVERDMRMENMEFMIKNIK